MINDFRNILLLLLIHLNVSFLKFLINNDNPNYVEIAIDDTPNNNRYKKRFDKVKSIIDDYTFEVYNEMIMNDFESHTLFLYGKNLMIFVD